MHFRSYAPRPSISGTATTPLAGAQRLAIFVALTLVTTCIGVAGVYVLRAGDQDGNGFQQGYELGRRAVAFVEDGTPPETACRTLVRADQISRGAHDSRTRIRERTAGCLQAVNDLTER